MVVEVLKGCTHVPAPLTPLVCHVDVEEVSVGLHLSLRSDGCSVEVITVHGRHRLHWLGGCGRGGGGADKRRW